jgi:H+/Cl- antiporter ClcA
MKRSRVALIGGLIIVVCFFLPWTKACGVKVSGFELARDSMFGDPVFWVVLASGLLIAGGILLAKRPTIVVILSTIAGAFVLLFKLIVPLLRGQGRELDMSLEIGGYGTILGYILAFIGCLEKPERKTIPASPSSASRE